MLRPFDLGPGDGDIFGPCPCPKLGVFRNGLGEGCLRCEIRLFALNPFLLGPDLFGNQFFRPVQQVFLGIDLCGGLGNVVALGMLPARGECVARWRPASASASCAR